MIDGAIILAGGKGTKMWPYSSTNNKAVLPVANEPAVARQVRLLHEVGVDKIAVVTGYRAEQVRYALRRFDGVTFVEDSAGAGTAVALSRAFAELGGGRYLVLYGDTVWTSGGLGALLKTADSSGKEVVAGLLPLGPERPHEWICAAVKDGAVAEVLGHPRDDVTHRFAGAFVLSSDLGRYLLDQPSQMRHVQVGMMPPDELHLEAALGEFLGDGGTVVAHEIAEPWFDLDKPWQLLEANFKILHWEGERLTDSAIDASASVSEAAEIEGPVVVGPGAKIGPGVKIKGPVWLGANSEIVDGAILDGFTAVGSRTTIRRYSQVEEGSAVGSGCVIGHAAEFGGVMFDGAFSFHYGEYWGVIGAKTDLGAATVCGNLRFDDDETIHNVAGHREKPGFGANAAYLGDFVRTGVNVIILPGVKIGAYSVIGPGTIVAEDVPDRSLWYVEQQIVKKNWGPERYGW